MNSVIPWAATGVCACFVLLHLGAERQGQRLLAGLSKLVASAAFLSVAWTLGAAKSGYGVTVLIALGLCAVGDALLLSREDRAFLGGLVSFLGGHVALAVAFGSLGSARGWIPGALLCLAGSTGGVLSWLLPHVERPMKAPVLAYCAVISVMVALAFGAFGAGAPWMIPAGAALFYLSDLAVARDRFVKPGFVNRAWGLPVYYFSTLLLAWSVAR
jgi:uncharacterized membrane protein YhhN